MKRVPIVKAAMLDELDNQELLDGYFDGTNNEPAPGDNRSYSYWHGFRNGQVDGGHKPIDTAQRELAKDAIETEYFK